MAGAQLAGIPLDAEGLDTAALERAGDCRLVYVTPSHQYPTGVTLSLARRLELLDWAERHDGWIVEDDYDGEYRTAARPWPLAALDRQGRVLYVGTFCKIAFPALRLGYLVLPPALVEPFARRRALDMRHSEIGTQAVMAEFIAAGHFQRHIRRMRAAARSRRDALLAGWPVDIPGCAPMPAVEAGLHLCVRVAGLARERQLIAAADKAGVELTGLSSYWLPGTSRLWITVRAGAGLRRRARGGDRQGAGGAAQGVEAVGANAFAQGHPHGYPGRGWWYLWERLQPRESCSPPDIPKVAAAPSRMNSLPRGEQRCWDRLRSVDKERYPPYIRRGAVPGV